MYNSTSKYNPAIHHRKSIRLKGYDYAQEGLYFITICCQDRACIFGEVIDGKMTLNDYGEIVHQEWLATEKIRLNTVIHEFIIMPNHIHGIIEITFKNKITESEIGKFQSPSQTIGSIIRGFKIAAIKKIKERILNSEFISSRGELQFAPTTEKIINLNFKIWQRNYYEIIIRNKKSYINISNYIINNPSKWKEDKFNDK